MKPPLSKGPRSRARKQTAVRKGRKSSVKKRLLLVSPPAAGVPRSLKENVPVLSPSEQGLAVSAPSLNRSLSSELGEDILFQLDNFDTSHLDTKVCSTPLHTRLSGNVSSIPLFDASNASFQPATPSFLMSPSNGARILQLSSWGLPEVVLEQYSKRGIVSMFEWQTECLMLPGVLSGGNLVYSAPTSAGKTLVAELLSLKCVMEQRKKVMLILPFVSVAHEKTSHLQHVFEPIGVRVSGFMGSSSPPGGFAGTDVAVCTIEKANSLVNRLLEDSLVHQLGAVVVDELHMVGDPHRGYLLELLLTKLLYMTRGDRRRLFDRSSDGSCGSTSGGANCIQIVGMSATLPNLDMLASWLGARFYHTDFRPVPLREMVKVGPTLYDTGFQKVRDVASRDSRGARQGDEEDILLICEETVADGHSVLIFCPSKSWCEKLASVIGASSFFANNGCHSKEGSAALPLDTVALDRVLEQLRCTQVGLDEVLASTVPRGVAFHHAGLTFDEREIVEEAFRRSVIRVLVATSTLSSGVNLPARLVVVRTPFFQRVLMDVLSYKQMVGRAGRNGVDDRGESILICKPSEKAKVARLFREGPRAVQSCLGQGSGLGRTCNPSAMKRALLEVISSAVATSMSEIAFYASCTLLSTELQNKSKSAEGTESVVLSALTFLEENEFIAKREKFTDGEEEEDGKGVEYLATQLGVATVASALSPDEALVVLGDLKKARRNFVLENELHIIYQVTPVYIQNQWPTLDWYRYLCLWEKLPADMRSVADILGISESFLGRAVQGRVPEHTAAQRERLRVHKRFFTALVLQELVRETPLLHVVRRFGASKGTLQSLQSAAGTFAGMVTVFCNRLGWKNLELLFSQFQSRLSFGVERELCEIIQISLLNAFRARVLYNAGFHTLPALASANPAVIETCLRNALPFKSSRTLSTDAGAEEKRNMACPRSCLNEAKTACLIIDEARNILSKEMNVPLSTWKGCGLNVAGAIPGKKRVSPKPFVRLSNETKKPRMQQVRIAQEAKNKGTQQKDTASHPPLPPPPPPPPPLSCPRFVPASALLRQVSSRDAHSPPCQPSLSSPAHPPPLTPSRTTRTEVCLGDRKETRSTSPRLEQPPSPLEPPPPESPSSPGPLFSTPGIFSPSMEFSMSFNWQTQALLDAACFTQASGKRGEEEENKEAVTSPASQPVDSPQHCSPDHKGETMREVVCSTPNLRELTASSVSCTQDGVTVIDIAASQLLFRTFLEECLEQPCLSVAVATCVLQQDGGIGASVISTSKQLPRGIPLPHRSEQVMGVSFCWGGMDTYYMSLTQDPEYARVSLEDRIAATRRILTSSSKRRKLAIFDAKKHLRYLAACCGVFPTGLLVDPTVGSWLLDPDAKEKTIHGMALHYLPDLPLVGGEGEGEGAPLSSMATHGTTPQRMASAESILAFLLSSKVEDLLEAEGLLGPFCDLEMPTVLVLAKMELNGIGFSPEACDQQRAVLQHRADQLEKKAYELAGRTFSLTSTEDVATVLFVELRLPSNGSGGQQRTLGATTRRSKQKRLQHASTSKEALEKVSSLHPLPRVVLQWRRVSSTLTKMVYPLMKEAVAHKTSGSVRIHPVCQIHTATGRVAFSDPNIQNVPKEYSLTEAKEEGGTLLPESQALNSSCSATQPPQTVCMRNTFVPSAGCVLLAADYSQLELRILAHMSGDKKLQGFLNSDGDVFKMIAGEWLGVRAGDVSAKQRQEAKQICYGMVYGIGPKALGEQLGIEENEALRFMETFKSKYPAMKQFLSGTVQQCRKEGSVSTLLGRKRLLPHIHSPSVHARSQAERQAVNTTVQGSAADLVKTAMTKIDRRLTSKGIATCTCVGLDSQQRCESQPAPGVVKKGKGKRAYLVLQLHDELMYEVTCDHLEEVARIVRQEMEEALTLSVKFPVKMKVGLRWGELKEYTHT